MEAHKTNKIALRDYTIKFYKRYENIPNINLFQQF